MEKTGNPEINRNRQLIIFLLLILFTGTVYLTTNWLVPEDDVLLINPPRMDVFGEMPPAREHHPSFLDKLPPGYNLIVFNEDLNGDGVSDRVAVHRMLIPVDALAYIHGLGYDFAVHGLILYTFRDGEYVQIFKVDETGFLDVSLDKKMHNLRAPNGFAFRMRMNELVPDTGKTTVFEFQVLDESGYPLGDIHSIYWQQTGIEY